LGGYEEDGCEKSMEYGYGSVENGQKNCFWVSVVPFSH
jgi:hypothetical protein